MREPRKPAGDAWPVSEEPTVVAPRDTLVGAPAPQPPAGPPPDRRVGLGMLLALGALVLIAIGIVLAWLLAHRGGSTASATTVVVVTTAPATGTAPAKVSVPRLIGLTEQRALIRLGQVGLRPKEVYRPTSKPKGVVVSQKPKEATSLARQGRVTLVIDSGAPKVKVPDVRGKSLADAQAALDELGLDSQKTLVASAKPAGTVVDEGPEPGAKLPKGSTVTLSVAQAGPQVTTTTAAAVAASTTPGATTSPTTTAQGQAPPPPTTATMPDVQNRSEAGAAQAIGQAGILPSIVFIPSDDPLGTVEQQAKSGGESVPYHSHVQINVSKGPGDKPSEQVPNAIGGTLDQAVAAMNGAHLRLIYLKLPVTSRAQAGKIVQQTPLGGAGAPQNAQVLVFLGAYQG
ncbi:MAG: PASTA domain-containing protein [Gaiellaceae bacterium]